jgi:hypothetical protein
MRRAGLSRLVLPLVLVAADVVLTARAYADPAPDKSGYTLFDPTPDADLRVFTTGRPTKGNSPITVDAGHFQIETDLFNYQHSNAGGVTTRLYTTADPVLKVGLTNSIDFELQFNGYNWFREHDPATGRKVSSADGAGDLVLRPKFNLFGNEGGPALAVIPYVKFPVASHQIGNGAFEGGVIAPFSFPLPWNFAGVVMPEVDVVRNASDAGRHFNYTQLFGLSHPIGSKTTVYAEIYSALGTDHATPPVYTFDVAAAYLVTPTLQLDAGVNLGLNHAAPNVQAYTGLSKRF